MSSALGQQRHDGMLAVLRVVLRTSNWTGLGVQACRRGPRQRLGTASHSFVTASASVRELQAGARPQTNRLS